MLGVFLRSVLHNVGVVAVGFGFAYAGTLADAAVGAPSVSSSLATGAGAALVALGFLLRLWATVHFYEHGMRVISLEPQRTLLTSGPYRFSRNPLYLGGNVFVFFGAALLLGSSTALVLTVAHLPLMDLFIRREERQLEREFGDAWGNYAKRVRRWG